MEIQDFGEKIGGAKKDLWKERGLSIWNKHVYNYDRRFIRYE